VCIRHASAGPVFRVTAFLHAFNHIHVVFPKHMHTHNTRTGRPSKVYCCIYIILYLMSCIFLAVASFDQLKHQSRRDRRIITTQTSIFVATLSFILSLLPAAPTTHHPAYQPVTFCIVFLPFIHHSSCAHAIDLAALVHWPIDRVVDIVDTAWSRHLVP
jgi:hypothetical protein